MDWGCGGAGAAELGWGAGNSLGPPVPQKSTKTKKMQKKKKSEVTPGGAQGCGQSGSLGRDARDN